jgi:hypothetical protein
MALDDALALTTLCWGIAAIAALIIAVPQAILLIRTALHRDPLWWFRLKTTLLFGSLGTALTRNVAIWADYALFDQRYFGTISQRWPADLVLSALVMLACVLAAVLYVKTQNEVRP